MTLRDDALKLHLENHGKLAVVSKVPIKTREDLALAYTPGVAEPCKEIKENKDLSFEYTCRGNMVAIVSDGTRVLKILLKLLKLYVSCSPALPVSIWKIFPLLNAMISNAN